MVATAARDQAVIASAVAAMMTAVITRAARDAEAEAAATAARSAALAASSAAAAAAARATWPSRARAEGQALTEAGLTAGTHVWWMLLASLALAITALLACATAGPCRSAWCHGPAATGRDADTGENGVGSGDGRGVKC